MVTSQPIWNRWTMLGCTALGAPTLPSFLSPRCCLYSLSFMFYNELTSYHRSKLYYLPFRHHGKERKAELIRAHYLVAFASSAFVWKSKLYSFATKCFIVTSWGWATSGEVVLGTNVCHGTECRARRSKAKQVTMSLPGNAKLYGKMLRDSESLTSKMKSSEIETLAGAKGTTIFSPLQEIWQWFSAR